MNTFELVTQTNWTSQSRYYTLSGVVHTTEMQTLGFSYLIIVVTFHTFLGHLISKWAELSWLQKATSTSLPVLSTG